MYEVSRGIEGAIINNRRRKSMWWLIGEFESVPNKELRTIQVAIK